MPRLTELRLERGSTLASFRDLGSSLANLRILWLSACGVRHLDGVGGLLGLEELYLAFNDVEDLTSIALHDRLEVCICRPSTRYLHGSWGAIVNLVYGTVEPESITFGGNWSCLIQRFAYSGNRDEVFVHGMMSVWEVSGTSPVRVQHGDGGRN